MDWIESLKTGVHNLLQGGAKSNDVGSQVLTEYPGLKNSPAFKNGYQVISASDPNRLSSDYAKQRGGELYQPGEATTPQTAKEFDALVNPGDPNKTVLEVYDQKTAKDPNLLKQFAFGEAIHGAKQDPKFAALRQEFSDSFYPDLMADKKQRFATGKLGGDLAPMPGGKETFEQMMNRSGTDAYIRAYFMKDVPNYGSEEWLSQLSPKQFEVLNKMRDYLKTGKQGTETQGMLQKIKVGLSAAFGGNR
jgi:hypothetical protein